MLVAVTVLAVYRITRVVTDDFIAKGLRSWVEERSEWFGYLVNCIWCFSLWIGLLPVVAAVFWGDNRVVFAGLLLLAGSAVAGIVATFVDLLEGANKRARVEAAAIEDR